MQLEFEVDNLINPVPTQTLHWNVEYPTGTQTSSRQVEKVSHLYFTSADIQGIVPLAEVNNDLIHKHKYRNLCLYGDTPSSTHFWSWNRHFPLPPSNLPAATLSISPSSRPIKAVKVNLFTPSCCYKPPGHTHTAGFKMARSLLNMDAQPHGYST